VTEAPLGRESLAAIAAFTSAPEITVSEAPLGRESMVAIRAESGARLSLPEITVGEASLGRESLVAVELETRPGSTPEAIRVDLASMPDIEVTETGDRLTMPWAEPAPDAKRAADAARLGRKLAPPKVMIKLDDADPPKAPSKRR
jgi:hypothetical protein